MPTIPDFTDDAGEGRGTCRTPRLGRSAGTVHVDLDVVFPICDPEKDAPPATLSGALAKYNDQLRAVLDGAPGEKHERYPHAEGHCVIRPLADGEPTGSDNMLPCVVRRVRVVLNKQRPRVEYLLRFEVDPVDLPRFGELIKADAHLTWSAESYAAPASEAA